MYYVVDFHLGHVSIILADVKNEDSLIKMAEQAKLVINCCGPYIFHGEPVIKACITARTHHVDVSGEAEVTIIRSFTML